MSHYIFRQKLMGVKGGAAVIDSVPDNMDSLEWIKGEFGNTADVADPLVLDLALESGTFRGAIIDGLLTLYHKKLCKVLADFGVENIQYFPVQLRDQETGKTEDTYFLVKILDVLDCADMEKSEVKYWVSGRGFDFLSMVIDETKTRRLPIFRLKDDPTKVVITDELKDHIEKNRVMIGVELTRTEDYSDF